MVHIFASDSQTHSTVFPWNKKYIEPWEVFLFLSFRQLHDNQCQELYLSVHWGINPAAPLDLKTVPPLIKT